MGIYGDPEQIRDIAHLLEVYATKYYQLESLLRPRLAEATLRSRLLVNLLSPTNSDMAAAHSLLESLNIHFRFPLYTVVISSEHRLSLPEHSDPLCRKLENLSFLKQQFDVWGAVDERLVLLCSSLEGRDIRSLETLASDGYHITLGDPCGALWQIQKSYEQALVLAGMPSPDPFLDIRDPETRCRYMLSHTAGTESSFLETLYRQLLDTFGPEESQILLESAACYYQNGKSVSAAAAQLFIHKNTLQYRVRRVLDTLEITKFPPFLQEYLVRLLLEHIHRTSRP